MDIKILIAMHKSYTVPKDSIYLPLHVGKLGKPNLGLLGDDSGDNISAKNPYFCELTGIYWAWKNLAADYVGLCHYRRHFTLSKKHPKEEQSKFDVLLTTQQAKALLQENDIILPKKRKYYIETLYKHYAHTLHVEPLNETEKIIEEKYPKYLYEFKRLNKRTSAHMFNMFIMKKEYFDAYCEWLFDILFELENRFDPAQYDSFHARYLGRVSELLLDVWINTNKLSYKEIPFIEMQGVNLFKKATAFLEAKFIGKKYDKSF